MCDILAFILLFLAAVLRIAMISFLVFVIILIVKSLVEVFTTKKGA